MGHSMGSGGTWYLGAKYSQLWRAISADVRPFVDEANYSLGSHPDHAGHDVRRDEGVAVVKGSHLMRDWMMRFSILEVDADHGGMVTLTLPAVFEFFRSLSQQSSTNPGNATL